MSRRDKAKNDRQWAILRVRGATERKVAAALGDLDIEVWCPTRRVTFNRRHRRGSQRPRKTLTLAVPIVKRVLFVAPSVPLHVAMRHPFVYGAFVWQGSDHDDPKLALVCERAIRRMIAAAGGEDEKGVRYAFDAGDAVRILFGPLAGTIAVVRGSRLRDGREVLRAGFQMLGREQIVEINASSVEALAETQD